MSGNEKTKLDRLIALYKVFFGPFPKLDAAGNEVWFKFLDRIPMEKIESLVEKVSEESTAHKPMFKDFRNIYNRMEITQDTPGQAEGCRRCGKTGWLDFPGKQREETGETVFDLQSKYIFAIPCTCPKGQLKPRGFNAALQIDAIEYTDYKLDEFEELKKERTENGIERG